MFKPLSVGFGGLLSLFLVACFTSTTIEQSWRAPDVKLEALRNVVTVYIAPDGSIRRTIEDEMASKLARKGIRATPMYTVMSEDDMLDRDRAKARLIAAGFDGVVAIRLVSKESFASSFDDYWGSAWPSMYDPNYAFTEVVVRVETNVYSLASDELLWSALSRTIDPASSRTVVDEVTTLVAGELSTHGVVVGSRLEAKRAR
jgi:hypothetical protein